MQRKALKEINRYRAMGVHKALTVASMGARVIIQTGHEKLVNSTVYGISGLYCKDWGLEKMTLLQNTPLNAKGRG